MNEGVPPLWYRMKKTLGILGFAFVSFGACGGILMPSGSDHWEAQGIADILERKYGEGIKFASIPKPFQTELILYGIVEESEQDDLIEWLSGKRKKSGWNPIEVRFYERQVREVTEFEDGSVLSVRGNEVLLRTERITSGLAWW